MSDITGKRIVVWFSCGAASAVAAKRTVQAYGEANNVRIVNNPVAEEDDDNRRFRDDVEAWIGVPIERATNPKYPDCSAESVWASRKYMSGVAGAPCTMELKKHARELWERDNPTDYMVLGFTVEETKRHERFVQTERSNVLPVLIEAGLTKQDCYDMLVREGIEPPRMYAMGYPNANCIGCVKATSPTYWNHVRQIHPEVFHKRAEQSRLLGARLVRHRGKRIFLDELPVDAVGRPMKSMNVECGIFCEESEDSDE